MVVAGEVGGGRWEGDVGGERAVGSERVVEATGWWEARGPRRSC